MQRTAWTEGDVPTDLLPTRAIFRSFGVVVDAIVAKKTLDEAL